VIRTNREEEEEEEGGDWRFLVAYKQREERVMKSREEVLLCNLLLRAHSTPGSIPDMISMLSLFTWDQIKC